MRITLHHIDVVLETKIAFCWAPARGKPRAPGCREPNPLRGFGPAGFHPMALLPAFVGGGWLAFPA